MKTKESIQLKWDKKFKELEIKADYKYDILFKNKVAKANKSLEYEKEKLEKKKRSYLRKKEEEYKRRCLNEIREMEWKPKREYKTEWPKIKPIQFAMELAQENARLRDSDADGSGRCISCGKLCSWGEHAWGHRYSRKFQKICLEEENINLQCHNCNLITWPLWNPELKLKTNEEYDRKMDLKFWEWTAAKLAKKLSKSFSLKAKKYDLKKKIPELIEKNEKLWATKNFYAPRRKWRAIWTEYDKRH